MNTPVDFEAPSRASGELPRPLSCAKARVVVSGRRDGAGQKLFAELREIGAAAEYWRAHRLLPAKQELHDLQPGRIGQGDEGG